MAESIGARSESEQILDVFAGEYLREKVFYRNTAIILFLLFVVDCAMVYLVNFKLQDPGLAGLSGYAILGLAALIVGIGFSMKIYFREGRRLKAVHMLLKDRGGAK